MSTVTTRPDYQDEWLLTDGLGGFAMGTRDGVPRRRYHGLCIASMAPPLRLLKSTPGPTDAP